MDFPFASAPDIIRANQKDSFVDIQLRSQLREVIQWSKGVRFIHKWSGEIDASAAFVYLGLTTLLGARTLGEEYTDLIYLTNDRKLASTGRRVAFVLASSLSPLLIKNLIMKRRQALLAKLDPDSWLYWVVENTDFTTLATINLTLFYFVGSYYQLSKRIFGLRYAFGHRVDPTESHGTYEFLGLLLVAKAMGKLVNKLRAKLAVDLQTPVAGETPAEFDLVDEEVLPFIPREARNCNLCLDSVKTPTVTLCGHMFCWSCISEWCRDNQDCPLCRQKCHEQNLLVIQP